MSLAELRERVAKATEADRALEAAILEALNCVTRISDPVIGSEDANLLGSAYYCHPAPILRSLDAAIALVEAKLPGWGWQTGCPLPYNKPREFYASVWRNGLHVGHDGWTREDGKPLPPRPSPAIYAPTPALALIAALLAALEERKP